MGLQVFKELLSGKYNGVAGPTLLPPGSISDGLNMRKASGLGGWKVRKGCTVHNTTAIADAAVLSLHAYKHPRQSDYHFIAQCNGSLYDAGTDPPTTGGTTFASGALTALAGATNPGYSDIVQDYWFYADGDGAPIMWGGDNPFAEGFLYYNATALNYVDYTKDVTDADSGTSATITLGATDKLYIASPCRAKGVAFTLGSSINNNAQTIVVKSWVAGAWDARTVDTSTGDGTGSGGPPITTTMTKSGTVLWTFNATDSMRVLKGKMAYWYEISATGALDAVEFTKVTLLFDPERISNKWSGVYETPLAVRFYDQSATEYVDYTGKLTNESTSQYLQLHAATTSDELWVKTAEPACGLGFGVVDAFEQIGDAQIDQIEYWDGDSFNAITTGIIDETLDGGADSSFAQSGTVWWNAAGLTVKKRTTSWDSIPGYWYKVTWDAALAGTGDDARIFLVVAATFPESLPAYDGVVEFKGRAFVWGDPLYPNRLRYSANGFPTCFSGSDSGYTDSSGDNSKILRVVRFYNELVIFKRNSVWMLEGYTPATFGLTRITDEIGAISGKAVCVTEAGTPIMHGDEPLSVLIWADSDGVYMLDGRKPHKVSPPVDHYFNTEYTGVLGVTVMPTLQAFVDPMNNEYHLLTQTSAGTYSLELVYNYVLDEWYPPWERKVGASAATSAGILVTGLAFRDTNGRWYTYGGNGAGFVFRLESDTSDKSEANADVAIIHKLKTRAIGPQQDKATTFEFTFRKAWIEARARASGSVTTYFYKDLATSGVELTAPGVLSLVNSGYALSADGLSTDQIRCKTFQLEFVVSTVDVELELWSFVYMLEAVGELHQ